MNGKKAKQLKKFTFDALQYAENEISSKPTHVLPNGTVNKSSIYRTKKFRQMYRARKKNYCNHVTG